jgi:hypothetical protein
VFDWDAPGKQLLELLAPHFLARGILKARPESRKLLWEEQS